MKLKAYIIAILITQLTYCQVPFPHISTSTFNAERVASFGVIDVANDFLEITNSTQFDNSFIPSIWAHQQSDNRFVLRHFATTNSIQDNGTIPLMIFRTEIRNNLNLAAPSGGSFPWGTTASNVANRPLFGWENGNTQIMRILANGNVGIGTITPTSLFHTNGTVRFENLGTTTSNTYVLTTDTNGNVTRQLSSSFGSGGLVNNCTTTNFLMKKGNTDIICSQIFDNGTGVGINTVVPTALFHTNGTLRFENLADATTPSKILGTDTQGNVFEYNPGLLSGGDADWLKPDNTIAGSINDDIYTNGHVGINVQNPSANFHTNGTIRFENIATTTANTYVLTTDINGNVSRQLSSSLGGGIANNCNTTNFLIKKGTTDLTCSQIFDNGTGVGINTSSPTALFHTNGSLRFENLADSVTPVKLLGTDSSGNVFEYNPATVSGSAPDADWLKPDNTLATSINDNIYTNGKVGINTSFYPTHVGTVDVSNYSLFAKGGILTEEVRVALESEWADYVFCDEYKLEPLPKVEEYIKENNHLKDIPSSDEVKRDGIELGEMNKLLLAKIEELTLYIINLDKKLEVQRQEIETLKGK